MIAVTFSSVLVAGFALLGMFGICLVLAAALVAQWVSRSGAEVVAAFGLRATGSETRVQAVCFAQRTNQDFLFTAHFAASQTSNGASS